MTDAQITATTPLAEPPEEAGAREPSNVIARAATILFALAEAPQGLTLAELARGTGLARSTVQRLVLSLAQEGFVNGPGGRVRLGPSIGRLAAGARVDAAEILRPWLAALAQDCGETVDLWALRGGQVELLEEIGSQHEVRVVAHEGMRMPLATTAPGKLFLAQMPPAEAAAVIAREFTGPATALPARQAALAAELAEVRRTGLAWDIEEHAQDVCAVACLVRLDARERLAIALPAPFRRFSAQRAMLAAALTRAAEAIDAR